MLSIFANQNANEGGGTASLTVNSVPQNATILVGVAWRTSSGVSLSSVSVSGESNASAVAAAQTGTLNHTTQWFVLPNVTSGGNKTITATWSASPLSGLIWVIVLQGADNVSPVDDHQVASGSSTTASRSLTATAANDASFAMIGTAGASEPSGAAGLSAVNLSNIWNVLGGEYDTDADIGAAGAYTLSATVDNAAWEVDAVLIKPAVTFPNTLRTYGWAQF